MTVPAPPPDLAPALLSRPGDGDGVRVALVDGLVLVAWSLLGQLLVGVLVVTGLALAGVDVQRLSGVSLAAVTVLAQSLTLAGALAWLSGRGRLTLRLLGTRRPRPGDVLTGAVAGLLVFGVSAGFLLTADALFGPLDESGQALLDTEMLRGPALLLTVVIAGVLAPVLEELTFRGVLFEALGKHVRWGLAVLYSGLFFGIVHLEVLLPLTASSAVYGTALVLVGVLLALVLRASRSLVAAVVAHATFNVVQVLLAASGA